METTPETFTKAPSDLFDSPAVSKAKAAKAEKKATKKLGKKIRKGKKAVKKAVKAFKKAAKKMEKAEKKSRRAYSDVEVGKALSSFKTIRELAKAFKITAPAAQNYVNALKDVRKVETKEVRQGLRGPLAIAYRVA